MRFVLLALELPVYIYDWFKIDAASLQPNLDLVCDSKRVTVLCRVSVLKRRRGKLSSLTRCGADYTGGIFNSKNAIE